MACNDALCRVARVGLPARPRVFSALRWGSAPTAAASHALWASRAWRPCPRLAGARLGKDPGSGGCTKGKQQLGRG